MIRGTAAARLLVLVAAVWLAAEASAQGGRAAPGKPYRVLMLKSLGANFAPFHVVAASFRASLIKSANGPVEFYEAPVDLERLENDEAGGPMATYLKVLFSEQPPDLMVAIGRPAARFAVEHREGLFPSVPLLITGMEEAATRDLPLGPRDGLLCMDAEEGPFADMLGRRTLLKELLVVVGDGPHEQFWRKRAEATLARLFPDVPVTMTNGMSLGAILERARALPTRSLVIFASLSEDADGVPYEFDEALEKVVAASPVPVMGLHDYQLGKGVVAVLPLPVKAVGHQAGIEAARLLAGGQPRVLPHLKAGPIQFDARVLDRFNIPEAALPPGAEVLFREPSLWSRVRPYVLVGLLVVGGQSILIVLLLRSRKRQARAEAAHRQLAERVLRVQEEERARIARELHDDLSQRVAWLSMLTGREAFSEADRAAADRELKLLGKDLSQVAYSLHPAALEKQGLVAALKAECHRFGQAAGLAAAVETGKLPEAMGTPVMLCAYRVVQEALRNASRHGKAKRVRVYLTEEAGGLQLAVRDDGAGFSLGKSDAGLGLGLRSMRERVRALGGEVDVESTPGEGTEVVAWIPWEAKDPREAVT
jgi:signal transduction histidine kinase